MNRLARNLVAVLATLVVCESARADSIDIAWFVARAGPATNPLVALGIVIVLIFANYGLNYWVIGRPVIASGLEKRQVVSDLVLLTFWGQLADRAGIVPAGLLSEWIARRLHVHGIGDEFMLLVATSFLFSALAVGALALYYLRGIWKLDRRRAWKIAGLAASITNPAWAMALWLL